MKLPTLVFLLLLSGTAVAQAAPAFRVVVLGCQGGLVESNLSSYLLCTPDRSGYLSLDAGTLASGLKVAASKGTLEPADLGESVEGTALHHIKGYLISHAHFDHLAGLVIDSPEDSKKPVVGLDSTIDALCDHVFHSPVWSNFGDEGLNPIGRYHYQRVQPGVSFKVANCPWDIQALPLSHSDQLSTAYILTSPRGLLVYCGDTGPDGVEGGQRMLDLWKRLAPEVASGRLKGLFLEVSFPDGRSDKALFGHLTPTWMMREMHRLADLAGQDKMRGLRVVVSHIKPALSTGPSPRQLIEEQLRVQNDLGIDFIIPEQGQALEF